jgi:hypothetical protein
MEAATLGTLSQTCEFGHLEIDALFLYHEQLYRKESELSALLIRWASSDQEITELVSHRFFPEIIVELPDDSDEAS